ncbi:hypothetical protein [Thioalkalivibrio thiocyanodenitrificans]|uniref:hypothetical protein n=1 Tax=Thioalkalivibrio thiocyanodenitrificans TaxID=243063 RepID=UPI00035D80EC|nr:hypothetical protein [Thioalkalivibrio thiocyanodenitrificans]
MHPRIPIAVPLLILALAQTAAAQTRTVGPELEVYFKREISDWRPEGAGKVETRINRVGVLVRDHVAEGLWIGLHGGYLGLTQSGNPATRGMNLTGWHLGTSVRWRFLHAESMSVSLLGQYTYNEADDAADGQSTAYDWHEYGAGLETAVRLDRVRLRLGVDYTAVDGDERTRGLIRDTRSISEDEAISARAALDLLVDATGRITFQVEAGGRRGAGIWFARQF